MSQRPVHSNCSGYTIVEVTLVAAMLAVLGIVIIQSTRTLSQSQDYHRTQIRIADGADRLVREIEWDANFALKMFDHSTTGLSYYDAMGLDHAMVPDGSRLPAITSRGYFDADPAGTPETGNLLMLARSREPIAVKLPASVGGGIMRMSLRFFVIYHLRKDNNGLDITRWASVPLADQSEILQVEDTAARQALLVALYEAGIGYAWDATDDTRQGLVEILEGGTQRVLPNNLKLPRDDYQSRQSLLLKRSLQVAQNGELGTSVAIPAYAKPHTDGFPAGFEVKIDGQASGKMLLIRLVVVSTRTGQLRNFTEANHIFACGGD